MATKSNADNTLMRVDNSCRKWTAKGRVARQSARHRKERREVDRKGASCRSESVGQSMGRQVAGSGQQHRQKSTEL